MDSSNGERKTITLKWEMEDLEDVGSAKEKFIDYVGAGWLAFALTSGNRRVQIFEFDPKLKTIILIQFAEGG